ncbi:MAG: 50S ribosomal protein L17 [Endomicrobiales bacterium]|nr:50S ribosomal protein L17 [Endomicrobiales bacterium]
MIKNLSRRKLSRTGGHRRSTLRNLATALFQHEKIKTTLPKAKELASYSEKLISTAKPSDLVARRYISREIKDKNIQKKLFEILVPRYQDRSGGFTQIFRIGERPGDGAEMAIIRLIS